MNSTSGSTNGEFPRPDQKANKVLEMHVFHQVTGWGRGGYGDNKAPAPGSLLLALEHPHIKIGMLSDAILATAVHPPIIGFLTT